MNKKIISILVCVLMIPLLGSIVTAYDPPLAPIIDGPDKGDAHVLYSFTFVATDPDGTDIMYFVEWGDGKTTGWTPCYYSGETIILKHEYDKAGIFTITARAQECPQGAIGPDGTHVITVPRSRQYFNMPYLNYLYQFLMGKHSLFPILRILLKQ